MVKPVAFTSATLSILLGVSTPAFAQQTAGLAAGAQVYELNENARFILTGPRARETSTSQFLGFANPGTPVCPADFAVKVAVFRGQLKCVVNLTGTSQVSLVTGLGRISGRFTVVTADPTNPDQVDAPETVMMQGEFRGEMDFSPALQRLPYGTVTGHLTSDAGGRIPFFGVFVLPFAASGADLYLGYELLSIDPPIVQLTGMTPLQSFEYAIGYPADRFDIYFPE